MLAPYTGNGPYCYANALAMCLGAAGVEPELREPGFLEFLTTMPFGHTYRRAERVVFWFDAWDPDRGLHRALGALGWTCDEAFGGDEEDAWRRLVETVRCGPTLLGPVDLGLLPYNGSNARGADHFVVALDVEDDRVLLHDPGGLPCAVATRGELTAAWRAEAIGYKRGPYTLRTAFRPAAPVDRAEAIRRTLPLARANVVADPGGAIERGGAAALRLLADDLRSVAPPELAHFLTRFALPLAARRSLDAAACAREGGLQDAGDCLERRARRHGEAQRLAVRGEWRAVASLLRWLAELEEELAGALPAAS